MRSMVVEAEIVVQDGECGMVEFHEVLEAAGPFVAGYFNVVDLDGWEGYGLRGL